MLEILMKWWVTLCQVHLPKLITSKTFTALSLPTDANNAPSILVDALSILPIENVKAHDVQCYHKNSTKYSRNNYSYRYAHKRAVDSHLMNMFYGILNEICFLGRCLLIEDTIQSILDSIKDEAKNKFKHVVVSMFRLTSWLLLLPFGWSTGRTGYITYYSYTCL